MGINKYYMGAEMEEMGIRNLNLIINAMREEEMYLCPKRQKRGDLDKIKQYTFLSKGTISNHISRFRSLVEKAMAYMGIYWTEPIQADVGLDLWNEYQSHNFISKALFKGRIKAKLFSILEFDEY